MRPYDRIEYESSVSRAKLQFPGSTRLVVWPIVNVENWDIERPMPRTVLPPPGAEGAVPDLPNWAWHEYGMRVGFWRLRSALQAVGAKATLSINASVCERYPVVAAAARDDGWEFMGHSYVQRPMHFVENEREAIHRTAEVITSFTGKGPRGWLGPGLTETEETVDLLAEAGFEYVADWVIDDLPCKLKTRTHDIYTLPYSVELNDIPMMMIQHHKAEELYDRTVAQFRRLYQEAHDSARIMAIAVHPYITGVPHRIAQFERALEALAAEEAVEFWTGEQILDWYIGEASEAS